jgi:hypothetical protein
MIEIPVDYSPLPQKERVFYCFSKKLLTALAQMKTISEFCCDFVAIRT